MKALLLVLALALVSGCVSRTEYGSCVGIYQKRNPKLEYKLSARNLAVGIIFFELIAPPIVVAVDETYCPIGPAEAHPESQS